VLSELQCRARRAPLPLARQCLKNGKARNGNSRATSWVPRRRPALAAGATSSELERFGLGAVQEIDAAAMSVWIKCREQTADVSGITAVKLDDFRYVSAGAQISF
jgi:hypothetical protein